MATITPSLARAALAAAVFGLAGCHEEGIATTRPVAERVKGALRVSTHCDDPRRDPRALARAKAVLETSEAWAEGYARLVRSSGSLAALALAETGQASSCPTDPDVDALLADLLGATLVDAGDELREARHALDAAGRPAVPEKWMTQPPPWPPASVAQILGRESSAMPLLETLAAQVAPEADVRAWLLRSWLAPPRLIDNRVLAELAGAADGRLVREPRFRAWLRSEWRAWARQRYRRVARLARASQKDAPP